MSADARAERAEPPVPAESQEADPGGVGAGRTVPPGPGAEQATPLARRRARDLPGDLALPLPTGEPWWYWLGGRPSLDFVNTRRERWHRRVETLVTPEDLADWLVLAELLDAGRRRDDAVLEEAAHLLGPARRLREAIDALVTSALDGVPPRGDALAVVDQHLHGAVATPRLTLDAHGRPSLMQHQDGSPIALALGQVALDAARMLGTEERDRVRVCGAADCSARFYDASRPGRRRWCSMGGCGNREKARRHRARDSSQTS